MRLAVINLRISAAKGAEPFEGLDQPERQAGLFAPRAPADDAVRAPFSERASSFRYGSVVQELGLSAAFMKWSSARQERKAGADKGGSFPEMTA